MEERADVEISRRAEQDLRRVGPGPVRDRIVEALQILGADANADVKAIVDASPWLRLRVGDYRIVFRRLDVDDLERLRAQRGAMKGKEAFLVSRVVHRRDLVRTIRTLS